MNLLRYDTTKNKTIHVLMTLLKEGGLFMKYGFIYETTNLITGQKYIGQHRRSFDDPSDPDDSWYLGSGVLLGNAIDHYGMENFSRRIIEECDSPEELNDKEIYYIRLYDAVNSHDYYNISDAPQSGYPVTKGMKLPDYWKSNLSSSHKLRASKEGYINPSQLPGVGDKISKSLREGYASGKIKKKYGEDNPMSNPDTVNKMRQSVIEAMSRPEVRAKSLAKGARLHNDKEFSRKISEGRLGDKNPCYGKIWINNGEYNRRVTREEFLKDFQSKGFVEGRLCKPYGKRV